MSYGVRLCCWECLTTGVRPVLCCVSRSKAQNAHPEAYFSHFKRNYAEDACNLQYFVPKNTFLVKKQLKSTSEDMLQENVSGWNSACRNLRVVTHFENTFV